MNNKKKTYDVELKIGSTTYLITRSFKENAKEDAAMKMAKIIRNDAERQLRDRPLPL